MDKASIILAIICSTLIILLLIAGVIITFFISAQKQKQQALLLSQTKLEFEREIRQVESEVSEQIMGQFARELHDNIGQLLTAMHIQIENQKLDAIERSHEFKPLEIYLEEVTQQLRLLSRTLNHDYIGHIGLFSAIQLEIDRINQLNRFKIHWESYNEPSHLNKNQELMIFRIFQEAMQNIMRHASAQNVYIHVQTNVDAFKMEITDDGKGFDLDKMLLGGKGLGIQNMIKRAKLAGIDCRFIAAVDSGCQIILQKQ